MVKKVESEENLKFPLAFGGECKADFEATLVQAKMHRAQALINKTKQFEVLEKLWNLLIVWAKIFEVLIFPDSWRKVEYLNINPEVN